MGIKSISIRVNAENDLGIINDGCPLNINITIENHFDKPVGAVVVPGVDEQAINIRKVAKSL